VKLTSFLRTGKQRRSNLIENDTQKKGTYGRGVRFLSLPVKAGFKIRFLVSNSYQQLPLMVQWEKVFIQENFDSLKRTERGHFN